VPGVRARKRCGDARRTLVRRRQQTRPGASRAGSAHPSHIRSGRVCVANRRVPLPTSPIADPSRHLGGDNWLRTPQASCRVSPPGRGPTTRSARRRSHPSRRSSEACRLHSCFPARSRHHGSGRHPVAHRSDGRQADTLSPIEAMGDDVVRLRLIRTRFHQAIVARALGGRYRSRGGDPPSGQSETCGSSYVGLGS
jgi:hypothetical protein